MKRSISSIRHSGGSAILLALLILNSISIATSQQNQISDEQRQLKRQQRVTRRQQQRRRQRNVVGIGNGIVDSTISDTINEVAQPAEDTKLEEHQEDEIELQLLVTEGENEEQQRLAYFKEHIQQENELLEMEWDTNYIYDVQVSSIVANVSLELEYAHINAYILIHTYFLIHTTHKLVGSRRQIIIITRSSKQSYNRSPGYWT